ncbi:hypothetical protein [Proteus phage vB_PmiP_RS1pmA]|uniref:DUF1146 domain-containing protein n=1 Tax=Proteus phage vB_PmiP_RS1pmA TaxID=2250312 RepID=A0A514CY16_9CAUD|nr:hypothetical protein [Proteus phage vB_PmiP_RS1pmA]
MLINVLSFLLMSVSVFFMVIILETVEQAFITRFTTVKRFTLSIVLGIWLGAATASLCYTLYMNL